MKKLLVLQVIILIAINSFAQVSDSLGWNGKPVIPLANFINTNNWHPNSSAGDNCYVTHDITDTSSICLHWKFNAGTGHKYAQIYFVFSSPVSLSDKDIFGVDVKGNNINDNCTHNLDIQIKFESLTSAYNATFAWHNLARIERWCENISALKKQFQVNSIDWSNVSVVSLEVNSDSNFATADSGTVHFRGLRCENISSWERTTVFSSLDNSSPELLKIKESALDTIISRQSSTGLLYTWREDGSSWLYGQGLALKILSIEGWDHLNTDSVIYQNAARKLATFLAGNQNNLGYWPRAWHTATGQIMVDLESDGSIWLGDFPWAITGLANYFKKTNDSTVFTAINKARRFLTDSLIDVNGKLFTLRKTVQNKYVKQEVTSVEAYNAVILGLLELNDTARAVSLARYIDSATWDNTMKYWNESIGNPRAVLFANTWFSQLIRNNKCISDAIDPVLAKSKDALTFVGRVLYTDGPGKPQGFDGIGPVATWIEGTLSYISAGGPGSQAVFDSVTSYISPGYAVPHYNDVVSCDIGGIWAVKWISLDGTSWLWYASSKTSPFKVSPDTSLKFPVKISENEEPGYLLYPNPARTIITVEIPFYVQGSAIFMYNYNGKIVFSERVFSNKTELDVSKLPAGTYFIKIVNGKTVKILKVIRQ